MERSMEKSSAEIQREIDVDRLRIEDRIGAIQERMSPGQLVDEVLAYAKGTGSGEYVSNLGKALKENPLPVALMGVSLAWLIAKQGQSKTLASQNSIQVATGEFPLYAAVGGVRRIGSPEQSDGKFYSYFTDEAGTRFKAVTDEAGRRAGNFIDEAGKTYRGFTDAAGKHISQMTDDAGAAIDASTGWLSDTWEQVKDAVGEVTQKATETAGALSNRTSSAGTQLADGTTRLNDAIITHFRDQPLVGGALAFAMGAAIGAALPHTEREDQVLGKAADDLKDSAKAQASDAIDRGKEVASNIGDQVLAAASEIHDSAKDRIVQGIDQIQENR
ncbi:DUF3618 domain-containing protein [Rhizobium tubonense]|uniref:Nutrient deprivation-induced protein n=1 Tax=Rhizobium tubonense TaxID=484088 RepID=A0A2W4CUU5_9HYPH|nr:DUF3618 domain-containing protein [Rhizobium tubonense]PZM16457.1 nutrient deprivation-induced protein [Rhizobium tubonense]